MIWGVIGGILLSLLASELYDSCPRLTNLLLRSASRRLPAECRDRYREEWMGELDAQRDLGKLQKLGWALWVFLLSGQTGRTLQSAIEETKRSALAHRKGREEGKRQKPPVIPEGSVPYWVHQAYQRELQRPTQKARQQIDRFHFKTAARRPAEASNKKPVR